MTKGFWLTVDAILGILLLSALLLSFSGLPPATISQTAVLQNEFDLFKIWSQTRPGLTEMQSDIEWVFAGNDYELAIAEQTVLEKNARNFANATTAEGIIFQSFDWTSIRLSVYH